MIFPQMVTERHYQVAERQLQVVERRSGPFRLNLTTAWVLTRRRVSRSHYGMWVPEPIC